MNYKYYLLVSEASEFISPVNDITFGTVTFDADAALETKFFSNLLAFRTNILRNLQTPPFLKENKIGIIFEGSEEIKARISDQFYLHAPSCGPLSHPLVQDDGDTLPHPLNRNPICWDDLWSAPVENFHTFLSAVAEEGG